MKIELDISRLSEQLERIAIGIEELNVKIDKILLERFGVSHD